MLIIFDCYLNDKIRQEPNLSDKEVSLLLDTNPGHGYVLTLHKAPLRALLIMYLVNSRVISSVFLFINFDNVSSYVCKSCLTFYAVCYAATCNKFVLSFYVHATWFEIKCRALYNLLVYGNIG